MSAAVSDAGTQPKILVVGMNPGRGLTTREYSSLGRLNRWMAEVGVMHYGFVNVFDEPGAFRESQVDRVFLLQCVAGHSDGPIFSLGNTARNVLGKMKLRFYALPHPSYRNRKFNEPGFEEKLVEELRDIVRGYK